MKAQDVSINHYKTLNAMKKNYELNELNECQRKNLAAKAANRYEYSCTFATKLQNSIRNDSPYSYNS